VTRSRNIANIRRENEAKKNVRTNCNKTYGFVATEEDANSQRDIITQELKNATTNSSLKSQNRKLQRREHTSISHQAHTSRTKRTRLAHGTDADLERGEARVLVSRTLAGGGEVGASGAQSPAGGVEREEVGGVEAGEDELRLGGDAAEAGDAATEVDGGDDRLAAGRRGHVGHAEERDLGGEVGGLARRLRRGPGGGRHRPGDESEQQRKVAEGALHGWVGGGGISRSLGFVGGGLGAGWRGRLWMEKAGGWSEWGRRGRFL
jgi:hypothetical protein